MEELAKALGLDPSLPKDELIKQASALKGRTQSLERMMDCRYLLKNEVATDCIIQVNITSSSSEGGLPQAKRARTDDGQQQSIPPVTTKTIKAHALILSKQSEYFKAMMMKGKWTESQNKILEIEQGSEREFEAFKLLVELSYGGIYTRQGGGGPTFPHDTLMALIIVANMFEFTYCIEQCCDEMGHDLTSDNALGVIDSLAPLDPLREPIKELLDKAIDCMGPLEKLWTQGPFCGTTRAAVQMAPCPKLEATVDSLIYFLKTDKLKMESENTTSTLVHWWLKHRQGWTQKQKQEAFNKIMDSNALRFHYMDPIYLAAYAMRTPWMQGSAHHVDSFFQRSLLLQQESEVTMGADKLGKKRTSQETSTLKVKLTRQTLESLESEETKVCFIGFMAGFPMFLQIKKHFDEAVKGQHTMGLYVGWSTGGLSEVENAEEKIRAALTLKATITVGGAKSLSWGPSSLKEDIGRGFLNYFDSPWEIVMASNSPWFDSEGNMNVDITPSLAK